MSKRLNEAIASFPHGVFVKLSTRRFESHLCLIFGSPKDAADKLGEKSVKAIREEIQHIDTSDSNALLIAVRRAFFKVAKVFSAYPLSLVRSIHKKRRGHQYYDDQFTNHFRSQKGNRNYARKSMEFAVCSQRIC